MERLASSAVALLSGLARLGLAIRARISSEVPRRRREPLQKAPRSEEKALGEEGSGNDREEAAKNNADIEGRGRGGASSRGCNATTEGGTVWN